MQSPARVRYSPLAIKAASCAVACVGPVEKPNAARAGSRAFKVLGICTISLQFGSLPQASGIGRLPRGANDGSDGAGRDERKAATALTSVSVRRLATICMQSGDAAVRGPERHPPRRRLSEL